MRFKRRRVDKNKTDQQVKNLTKTDQQVNNLTKCNQLAMGYQGRIHDFWLEGS